MVTELFIELETVSFCSSLIRYRYNLHKRHQKQVKVIM